MPYKGMPKIVFFLFTKAKSNNTDIPISIIIAIYWMENEKSWQVWSSQMAQKLKGKFLWKFIFNLPF